MRLQLDSDWLRSRWPEIFDYQEGVYLYLQAPPLTSVLSHQFKWLGSGGHPGPVKIAFPGRRQNARVSSARTMTSAQNDSLVAWIAPPGKPGLPLCLPDPTDELAQFGPVALTEDAELVDPACDPGGAPDRQRHQHDGGTYHPPGHRTHHGPRVHHDRAEEREEGHPVHPGHSATLNRRHLYD